MTFRYLFLSAVLATSFNVAMSHTASAQDTDAALKALDDALPGALVHNPLDLKWETGGNDIKSKIVDAPALTSGKAVSVRVKKRQNKPWDSYIRTNIPGAVEKGETIEIYYWARTAKAAKSKDAASITLFLGRNIDPYDNIVSEDIEPSKEWALKSIKGVAGRDFAEGRLKVEYQLGRDGHTVEFGPIYVSTLGKTAD